jgi:hypothetical protein
MLMRRSRDESQMKRSLTSRSWLWRWLAAGADAAESSLTSSFFPAPTGFAMLTPGGSKFRA